MLALSRIAAPLLIRRFKDPEFDRAALLSAPDALSQLRSRLSASNFLQTATNIRKINQAFSANCACGQGCCAAGEAACGSLSRTDSVKAAEFEGRAPYRGTPPQALKGASRTDMAISKPIWLPLSCLDGWPVRRGIRWGNLQLS